MGKLKTLNINQTSTELVSVDDIDRLALLISNNELDEVAVKFIEDLIEREGYIDLRDCMDENPTITFSGCLNTPDSVAYEDALQVLENHGVTNECARKYIRVYTELLDILKTREGITDGKALLKSTAETLTELNLSNSELKEFQTIYRIFSKLLRINISNTLVSGDISVEKYNDLIQVTTHETNVKNIEGLSGKLKLRIVNNNNPDKIDLLDCPLLILEDFKNSTISSSEINYMAQLIKEYNGNLVIKSSQTSIKVLDPENLNSVNANALVCASNKLFNIQNIIPSWYDYQLFLKNIEDKPEYSWIREFVDNTNFDVEQLINLYESYPILSNINSAYLLYDGKSWFDLGYPKTEVTSVKFKTTKNVSGSSTAGTFGSRTAYNNPDNFSYYMGTDSKHSYQIGSLNTITLEQVLLDEIYNIYLSHSEIRLGNTIHQTSPVVGKGTYNLQLGKRFLKDGATETGHYGRIYTLFWYENNILTHCYVPIADNKLLDLYTGVEYNNIGTGKATYYNDDSYLIDNLLIEYNISKEIYDNAKSIYGNVIDMALRGESFMLYNGYEYFDSLVKLGPNDKLRLKGLFTANNIGILGSGEALNDLDCFSLWKDTSGILNFQIGTIGQIRINNSALSTVCDLEFCKEYFRLNNTILNIGPTTVKTSNYNLYIGARNQRDNLNENPGNRMKGRLYALYIYDTSTNNIKHWIIPYANNKLLDVITGNILEDKYTGIVKFKYT